jgi:hypothetical protein
VVTHALSVAAMAVVDVTDPSDRIRWEVGVALRTVGAHRLVFAVETAAPAGEVVEQVWRDVGLPVRDGLPLDREWLASVLFCYPPQRPRPASPDFRRLVASLRSLVLLRLAAGPAVALTAGPGRSLPSRG